MVDVVLCFSDFDFVSKLVVGVPIKQAGFVGLVANRKTCFTLLFFDSLGRALIKKDQNREELGFGSKRIRRNEPA